MFRVLLKNKQPNKNKKSWNKILTYLIEEVNYTVMPFICFYEPWHYDKKIKIKRLNIFCVNKVFVHNGHSRNKSFYIFRVFLKIIHDMQFVSRMVC